MDLFLRKNVYFSRFFHQVTKSQPLRQKKMYCIATIDSQQIYGKTLDDRTRRRFILFIIKEVFPNGIIDIYF